MESQNNTQPKQSGALALKAAVMLLALYCTVLAHQANATRRRLANCEAALRDTTAALIRTEDSVLALQKMTGEGLGQMKFLAGSVNTLMEHIRFQVVPQEDGESLWVMTWKTD